MAYCITGPTTFVFIQMKRKNMKNKNFRNRIRKIPILGDFAWKSYRKLRGLPIITSSDAYWEYRYQTGGNSGAGSFHILAEYKGEIINEFVRKNGINTVIEFGSGDGNQLKYFQFKDYIGYDVSQTAILKCREIYQNDSTKRFEIYKDFQTERADLVLSLDVIYHLVEDEVYTDYMNKLFTASKAYVIIYSSNDDDHENNDVAWHVRHRKFTDYVSLKFPDFELTNFIPNKHPFNGNNDISTYADFYIYEKRPEDTASRSMI